MGMITTSGLKEGEAFNKWINNRFLRNKNILVAVTGSTGSGKSYTSQRICELWYKLRFNKEFPTETHTCFSIGELMKMLSSGKLKKGELLIFEEAGANLNALDFQNKVSKVFTFVLQSFRSMNVGVIFNLPVLTMLNKSARLLLHAHFITLGIDFDKKICKIKPLFHQLNQQMGKSYWKYMRISIRGDVVALERFNYQIPSKPLVEIYEKKKFRFVSDLSKDFSDKLDQIEETEQRKLARVQLPEKAMQTYNMLKDGKNIKEIAKERGVSLSSVYDSIRVIKKRGFVLDKNKNLYDLGKIKKNP